MDGITPEPMTSKPGKKYGNLMEEGTFLFRLLFSEMEWLTLQVRMASIVPCVVFV